MGLFEKLGGRKSAASLLILSVGVTLDATVGMSDTMREFLVYILGIFVFGNGITHVAQSLSKSPKSVESVEPAVSEVYNDNIYEPGADATVPEILNENISAAADLSQTVESGVENNTALIADALMSDHKIIYTQVEELSKRTDAIANGIVAIQTQLNGIVES